MSSVARQLLPKAQRQRSILDGAERAFAQAGYARTTMEDVAAAAGITKLIVYRHFDSKGALYRRVLDRMAERLAQQLAREVRQSARGATVRSVLRVGREHPDGLRLLLVHAAREPEFADHVTQLRRHVTNLWVGRMPFDDEALRRWSVEVAVSYVWTSVLSWLDMGDPSRDGEFEQRCTAGLHGMLRGLQEGDDEAG